MRFALLLAISLSGLVTASQAQAAAIAENTVAKSFRIQASGGLGGFVTRIGAFRTRRDPTIRAAQRVFGRPSSRKLGRYGTCTVEWRRLRLTIRFENFGGHGPGQTTCTPTVGKAQSFVARSSRFKTWRGLRVRDASETITVRHPSAEYIDRKWWLKFAVSPFGDGGDYASLYATVSNGRVNALKGWIGAAGE